MNQKCTRIVDATLREGNQSSGVKFSTGQSIEIATILDELGIDMIEVGHPLAGPHEHDRTQAVASLGLSAEVIAHSRAHIDDLKAVARTGAKWAGIFLGVNNITTMSRVIGRNTTELVSMVGNAVRAAKDLDLNIRYSCEDASRTEKNMLIDVFGEAVHAGANRICYADTLGHAEPLKVQEIVKMMKINFPTVEVEVHLHDDRGLAQANALAAIDAGADWISSSVNGLGERCGITETATLLANLGFRLERPFPEVEKLVALSRTVSKYSHTPADKLRPVVGDNAFKHGSKLHKRASQYEPRAYDWIKEFLHQQEKNA